jgi:hypothetical protein
MEPASTEITVKPIVDVAPYEAEAAALVPSDDTSAQAAMLFIAKVREAEKKLDAERKAKTDPLRADIERIATPYKMAIDTFAALRNHVQAKLVTYQEHMETLRLEQQRKANADAERVRLLQSQKEEAARLEAERLRSAGDLVGALKQDTKADKAALAAAMTAPVIVEAPPKTIKFEGGLSVTTRKTKDWNYENGMPRGAKNYRDNPIFASLPDEVWVLDESKIGSIVRSGGKVAGVRVFETSTPVSRG